MKNTCVYILKCFDGSYYTGVTNDMDKRMLEHQNKPNPESYNPCRLPVELMYYSSFYDPLQAIAFEKQVKGWSRAKKEALINEDWKKLKNLEVNDRKINLVKKR